MHDLQDRLYRVKTTFFAVVLGVFGLAILFLARAVDLGYAPAALRFWPLGELGSTLFITGLVVVALDYWDGKDREARDTERLRRVIRQEAPAIRDAVIAGFAISPDDLARVATPEMLDAVIDHNLGLRLGDPGFAHDIYRDLRSQTLRAAERWHDARISVALNMLRVRGSASNPFTVTARCEYTVTPAYAVHRFACVSDRDEYAQLLHEGGGTQAWYFAPNAAVDAAEREAFELVQFTVDGVERPIRRSSRKDSQTYTVEVGADVVAAGRPVSVSYTYRTLTTPGRELLYLAVDQPTKGLDIEFDYSGTDITDASLLDFIATAERSRILRSPATVPEKVISLSSDSWVLPGAGAWRSCGGAVSSFQ